MTSSRVYISKLDAAKRQFEIAIRLFMSYGDIVAIHTLVSAAHTILNDLSVQQGQESFIKGYVARMIKPEYLKEFNDKINEAANFFKHADKDADKLLEFSSEQTEIPLLDICSMYQNLTNEATPLMAIYRIWYFSKSPDVLADESMKNNIKKINFDYNNRKLFLDLLPDASRIMQ